MLHFLCKIYHYDPAINNLILISILVFRDGLFWGENFFAATVLIYSRLVAGSASN
ncbi:hypothetical protein Mal48_42520 [Thalassoglobus polymorphus]|uniref:Uncharacterized protein n=1 Tax=Thalassoglobus polymorphus TaxID=2527994 RepID=A0A517QTK9_9PLAN|nr:hypothetical protein Mal48_42520 [Thalassoglobus polymorphus]